MLVEERLDYNQAEEYCRSKNAYLAELIESDERDAVWNYVRGNILERLETRFLFVRIELY